MKNGERSFPMGRVRMTPSRVQEKGHSFRSHLRCPFNKMGTALLTRIRLLRQELIGKEKWSIQCCKHGCAYHTTKEGSGSQGTSDNDVTAIT